MGTLVSHEVVGTARRTHLLMLLRVGERHGTRAADLGVTVGEVATTALLKMSLMCCMCDTRGGVFVSAARRLVVCRRRPIFAGEPATTADHNLLEGSCGSVLFCFVLRGDSLLNSGYWAIATCGVVMAFSTDASHVRIRLLPTRCHVLFVGVTLV